MCWRKDYSNIVWKEKYLLSVFFPLCSEIQWESCNVRCDKISTQGFRLFKKMISDRTKFDWTYWSVAHKKDFRATSQVTKATTLILPATKGPSHVHTPLSFKPLLSQNTCCYQNTMCQEKLSSRFEDKVLEQVA